MNSPFRGPHRRELRRLPSRVALLAASARMLGFAPAGEPPLKFPPLLSIDDSLPQREAKLAASFSPVVKKAAPSVVSIFTTKKVANFRLYDTFPFFDDPMLRRFFGEEPRGRAPSRPQFRNERGLGSAVIVTKDGSDKLEVIEMVLALGNPFGVGPSVSHGIVGAVDRGGPNIEAYVDFIQTDAPISSGNSGGALVDAQCRLVGINTAIATRTGPSAGVGSAGPANMARGVMDKLLKDGNFVRGFLSIAIQDLTPELTKEFDAPDGTGALVSSVEPKSAAAEAGRKSGDAITAFDGKPVPNCKQLRLMVAGTAPGTKVKLKLLRQGKPRTITVTLKEMSAAKTGGGEGSPDEVQGALVSEVAPDSVALEVGLRVGDVIQEVNKKPVRNAEDAVEATHNVPGKCVLLRVWSQGGSRFLIVDEGKAK